MEKPRNMISKAISVVQGFDWQMAILNVTSVSSVVIEAMHESSNRYAVGFLIVTVGILNLAKAYATVKKNKKED